MGSESLVNSREFFNGRECFFFFFFFKSRLRVAGKLSRVRNNSNNNNNYKKIFPQVTAYFQ